MKKKTPCVERVTGAIDVAEDDMQDPQDEMSPEIIAAAVEMARLHTENHMAVQGQGEYEFCQSLTCRLHGSYLC